MVETLTVFDDVFVPWDRVFLCGESAYAGALALGFVQFDRAGHVREKLSRLIAWRGNRAGPDGGGGARGPQDGARRRGPEPRDDEHRQAVLRGELPRDGAEGPGHRRGARGAGPAKEDLAAPETKGYIERYLGGRKGFGAANRLRVMNLIRDLLTSDFGGYNEMLSIHAEGSLEAQKLTILREFDATAARAFAAKCANLGAWSG